MVAVPSDMAVIEAVQAILGESPKSSLLFGAPAISMKQLEASLGPGTTLAAADVLPDAARVADEVFKGAKNAQLKVLRRGGKQEEWIVFRPALPDGGVTRPPPQLPSTDHSQVSNAAESLARAAMSAPDIVPHGNHQPTAVPLKQERTISTKRSFLRPFLRSKTTTEQAAPQPEEGRNIALPPAHKMGLGDFDPAWIPLAETRVAPAQATRRPHDTPRPAPKRALNRHDDASTIAAIVPLRRPPPRLIATEIHSTERLPVTQHTAAVAKSLSDTDSSLPYLSKEIIPSTDHPAPDLESTSTGRDEPEHRSNKGSRPQRINLDTLPPTGLIISLSPTPPRTPNPASPISSPAPLSPLSSIPSSPTSSAPTTPAPHSPLSETPPSTPWLSIVFQDLPFGPDAPAIQFLSWARPRWGILAAEMVVILGAVYIIQVLGV